MDLRSEALRLLPVPRELGSDRSIGAILIDCGKLTPEAAERVLRLQKEKGLRFGEAAIFLGLITEQDLHQVLSAQYEYPYVTGDESNLAKELVAAYQPFSRQVEMLRAIRSQLMLRWFNAQRRHLAIVSPGRREGRSYLAGNLAIVFSQLGERTLLLDADLRQPRQHLLFGLDSSSGLSTYLSGRTSDPMLHRMPELVDLSVMTAGPVPPNPQELVARPAFGRLLSDLAQQFDVIIIDTPAAEASADAQALALRAGGALMVTRQDHTRLRAIDTLGAAIIGTGGQIVGSVLGRF